MNITETILFAALSLAAIAVAIIPAVLCNRATNAWKALPPEVYMRHPQRLWIIRPTHLWIGFGVGDFTAGIFSWAGWESPASLLKYAAAASLGIVLFLHLAWSASVLIRRAGADYRLVRFAGYTLLGSAIAITILTALFLSEPC